MASSSRAVQVVFQVLLAIVIIVLVWLLYDSITTPYREVERRQEVTQMTRDRMDEVRQAMIFYRRTNDRFITSLDSLVMWLKSDSAMQAATDSVFGPGFMVDSLPYSPRTGKMFELAVNDTSQTPTYLLSDPDSDDHIGTLAGDVTQLNAASWE
jgi:hypothetical protein